MTFKACISWRFEANRATNACYINLKKGFRKKKAQRFVLETSSKQSMHPEGVFFFCGIKHVLRQMTVYSNSIQQAKDIIWTHQFTCGTRVELWGVSPVWRKGCIFPNFQSLESLQALRVINLFRTRWRPHSTPITGTRSGFTWGRRAGRDALVLTAHKARAAYRILP